MPRNIRNFWLELDVDGKRTRIETGPQAKDGGFNLTIRQRDKGGIVRAMVIRGIVGLDGHLETTAVLLGKAEEILSSIGKHTTR